MKVERKPRPEFRQDGIDPPQQSGGRSREVRQALAGKKPLPDRSRPTE
jgi:hypothetical protein